MKSGPWLWVAVGSCLAFIPAASAARIPCTQAAFEQAIADSNASGGQVTITFDCADTTILLDSARSSLRLITASGVVIDGEDRNIRFQMNPPWWDDAPTGCGGGDCDPNGDGVPDACPEVEGAAMFLNLQGNDIQVRNVAFDYFWDGIHMGRYGGSRQVLENVSCANPGDDCVSNPTSTGRGLEIRNSRFADACDKALQLYGIDITGTSGYDVTVQGNTFTNCVQPIHTPYVGGRYLVAENTFQASAPHGMYTCTGPRFDGSASAVYFERNTVDACRRGLRVGGTVHLVSRSNVYRGNSLRGAAVYGDARASFQGDRFENNGGGSSSETYSGGLSVAGTARVDAGGGSMTLDGQTVASAGQNSFLGNRSAGDPSLDLENQSSTVVKAENCWWGDTDPSDQVSGSVDYDPLLTGPPGAGSDPPSRVQRLRRTDVRP